jgi:hypothetical protein
LQRRAAALVWLLLLASCGTDHGPQTGPAITDGLPPLIVFSGQRVWRYADGAERELFELDEGTVALALHGPRDGIVIQQQLEESSNVLRVMGDDAEIVERDAELFETATIADVPSVVYGKCAEVEGGNEGDILVRELTSGHTRSIGMNCGPEYGVTSVSFGGDTFVTSAGCDLSECVSFASVDGDRVERKSPTDDLPYNDAPYMRDASLSPDGKLLAYLEGPDVSGRTPEKETGDWTLVVLEQPSGEEQIRVPFARRDRYVNRLDFDGRWAILSFADREVEFGQWSGIAEGEPGPVAAIDTTADEPSLRELGFRGVATIAE